MTVATPSLSLEELIAHINTKLQNHEETMTRLQATLKALTRLPQEEWERAPDEIDPNLVETKKLSAITPPLIPVPEKRQIPVALPEAPTRPPLNRGTAWSQPPLPTRQNTFAQAPVRDVIAPDPEVSVRIPEVEELVLPLDQLPLAAVVVDPVGLVRGWNTEATKRLGWTKTQIQGTALGFLADEDAGRTKELLQHCHVEKIVHHTSLNCRGRDGQRRNVRASISPWNENLLLVLDSPAVLAEDRWSKVTGLVHDVNLLLATILEKNQTIQDAVHPDDPLAVELGTITALGLEAADMIRTMEKVAAQEITEIEVTDVTAVLSRLRPTLPKIVGVRHQLSILLEDGPCLVRLDSSALVQMILNLVHHALSSLTDRGAILVRSAAVELKQPWNSWPDALPAGSYINISVTDNGTGMDEELIQALFVRGLVTPETPQGLVVVRDLLRDSGGFITVETASSWGSSVSLYLPHYRE